jgi:uncharacterized protein YifN (PemK superfamily)
MELRPSRLPINGWVNKENAAAEALRIMTVSRRRLGRCRDQAGQLAGRFARQRAQVIAGGEDVSAA